MYIRRPLNINLVALFRLEYNPNNSCIFYFDDLVIIFIGILTLILEFFSSLKNFSLLFCKSKWILRFSFSEDSFFIYMFIPNLIYIHLKFNFIRSFFFIYSFFFSNIETFIKLSLNILKMIKLQTTF